MVHPLKNNTPTVLQLKTEYPPRAKMDKENFINPLTASTRDTDLDLDSTITQSSLSDTQRSNPSPVLQQKVLLAVYNRKQIRVRLVFEDDVVAAQGTFLANESVDDMETVIPFTNLVSLSSSVQQSSSSSSPLSPNEPSNSTPTNQSTTTNSRSLLKSLLADTRRNLKDDGTPHEAKERRVYEEGDDQYHGNDKGPEGNMDDSSLLPSVSNQQPCSPMAAAPKNIMIPTTIVVQQLNDRMHHLFPFLQNEKEGKVRRSFGK